MLSPSSSGCDPKAKSPLSVCMSVNGGLSRLVLLAASLSVDESALRLGCCIQYVAERRDRSYVRRQWIALLPDQSFAPTSVKRNPAGVLVKTKMSSPQKTK
jgi:hypothetical protein